VAESWWYAADSAAAFDLRSVLLIWLGFSVIGLFVYGPALRGAFISDDGHYVAENPYVHDFTDPDNFIAIWDPSSVVTILVENYAPVHLVLHGIEWQIFGEAVIGYHVVNVLLHALAAALLAVLFGRSGIPRHAAIFGAAVFLLHPANVESVAWISQLKSSSSLVLTLAAVLWHPRHPLLAVISFALALFAKPFAAVALAAVALFGWVRTAQGGVQPATNWRWPWLIAWLGVVIGFALVEVVAFANTAANAPPLYDDLLARYLTMFAVALRYILMAGTSYGMSIFHEPAPVTSFLDAWFILSLMVLALLAARLWVCVRDRREEAVYWLWALISFGPLSGVVPLPYPLADRYLYFILPGLIGGALLAAPDVASWILRRGNWVMTAQTKRMLAMVGCGVLLLVFGARAHERAAIWINADVMMADAERNYPNGLAANTRKASRAARMGDFPSAVSYLEMANARGYNRLDHILIDPAYAPMQGYPAFVDLKHRMAQEWIDRLGGNPSPSQVEARAIAQAYIVLDDLPSALRVIEAAIVVPGPLTDDLRNDAAKLDRQIRLNERLRAHKERTGR
jgi:hypothetical protein